MLIDMFSAYIKLLYLSVVFHTLCTYKKFFSPKYINIYIIKYKMNIKLKCGNTLVEVIYMKRLTISIVFLLLILQGYNEGLLYYGQDIDPIEEVFNLNKSDIREKGIKIQLTLIKEKDIIGDICKWAQCKEDIYEEESNGNCVIKGEIKGRLGNGYYVKNGKEINIMFSGRKNVNLRLMKDKLLRCLDGNYNVLSINEYIIYDCNEKNINEEKNKIEKQIKKQEFSNVKESDINNSILMTMNSHLFTPINDGISLIDLSVAFVSYPNDKYIIISTPIIPITY